MSAAKKLIEQYNALVARAIEAVADDEYIVEEWACRVSVEGDRATLHYPELEAGYYDDYRTEHRKVSFPAHLLTMPAEEFAAWKRMSKKRKEEANQAAIEESRRQQERLERETLAALKAKYER